MKRIIALLLVTVIAFSASVTVNALPIISGETDGSTVEIYDGVYFTKSSLASSSAFGLQKLNMVEFDLADQSLDLQILKTEYIAKKNTIPGFVKNYNAQHEDSKVIAAVNGDLWMTGVHSNTNVTTSILTIPRGVLMSEGVVYCSSQIPNECTYTTNGEGHGYFWAFGLTYDYTPMIGQPVITLSVRNTDKNTEQFTEGFNRLPAHDSLIVYNGDCNYTNFALEDAYEVVLTDINGQFKFGETVTGTVSAIYKSNDGASPTLTKDSIVLTARGTAVDGIDDYEIGDNVAIDMTVRDVSGRNNDWTDAKLVIGGHSPLVLDGLSTGNTDSTHYPSTIVGYKNDGTFILIQNDGRQPTWSTGIAVSQGDELASLFGINSCIHLDGGGSSTMVVGEELVNHPSDGSTRAVINGLALVTTTDRAPQADFEITPPFRFNSRYVAFDNIGAVNHMGSVYSNTTFYTDNNGSVRLTASCDTIDPYIYYSITSAVNTINANNYKYIVMKYKTSEQVTTPSTELFLCAGAVKGPTGGYSVSFAHGPAGQWNTQIVDLTDIDYWKGAIYGFRIDYFAGNAKEGEYMDIEYIAFAKTLEDAQAYVDGTAELPTVPEENTAITIKSTSGFKLVDGYIVGIPCGGNAYDVYAGLTGPKLEVFDKDGNSIRGEDVKTGYTVATFNAMLEKMDEYKLAVEGDVNMDSTIDSADAVLALMYDLGLIELDEIPVLLVDVNGDNSADSADASIILQIDVGLIEP